MQASGTQTGQPVAPQVISREVAIGADLAVLTEIYRPNVNIAIWQRRLAPEVDIAAQALLESDCVIDFGKVVAPKAVTSVLSHNLPELPNALTADVAELFDTFCFLFDLKEAGLRLRTLDRAMCPKFHVDRVPCRLISTYGGVGTEWLRHEHVDRSRLGPSGPARGAGHLPAYSDERDIQTIDSGHVGLMKGEAWPGNEGAGLVHRSPAVESGSRRLLLTIDF
ncbi:MAG: DUF1826 domain-containing protein [Pseudomonadota bacterium]